MNSVEMQRKRMDNLRYAREAVKDCLYEHRIYDYHPGNVSYFLGEYPLKFSIEPTEYDYGTLKKYSELGITYIKVHEEWNDSIRVLCADKFTTHDDRGFRKFIDMCHSFGLKILPYVSAGYFHIYDPDFKKEWMKQEIYLTGQYFKYGNCSLESAGWRGYFYDKAMNIMDEYGVDGLYNDHAPDEMFRLSREHLEKYGTRFQPEDFPYDPYAEDFYSQLYHGIKSRGGTAIMHIGENYYPPTKERVYDYLMIGENISSSKDLLKGKAYSPYIINLVDRKTQTEFGADYPYVLSIPYMQFTCLNHGRRLKLDKTTADVTWHDVDMDNPGEESIITFWRNAAKWAQEHPDGPYTHGEFSAIPDPDDIVDRYGAYLQLYLPMVKDDSVAHIEIHEATLLKNPKVPDEIIASLFTNEEQYLVFSNIGKTPWEAELTDEWTDRRSGIRGCKFTVPPELIIFLRKV